MSIKRNATDEKYYRFLNYLKTEKYFHLDNVVKTFKIGHDFATSLRRSGRIHSLGHGEWQWVVKGKVTYQLVSGIKNINSDIVDNRKIQKLKNEMAIRHAKNALKKFLK